MPTKIPHKKRLVITGEGFIHKDDFERIREETLGKEDKKSAMQETLLPPRSVIKSGGL